MAKKNDMKREESKESKKTFKEGTREKNVRNSDTKSRSKNKWKDKPINDKDLDKKAVHNNDASWYAGNSTLLNSAANISFPVFAGKSLGLDPLHKYPDGNVPGSEAFPLNEAAPGGMIFEYHTVPGIATDRASAINVAANNIYQYVRHANSGHTSYDPQDYMLYLLGMDSLYAYYAWMIRIYGLAQAYSMTNRYVPKTLLQSLNIDCDNIQKHGNDFLYLINNSARKMNSFAVPGGMSYYERHIWLNSHVWADDTSEKAQYYMYNPSGFYKYEEVASTKGGKLSYVHMDELVGGTKGTLYTIENIAKGFNTLYDAIMASEDCGIMMGDTLKAFGSNIIQVAPVDSNYQVFPEYNEEVLGQIHNIETTGSLLLDSIEQDPDKNMLVCRPNASTNAFDGLEHLLDCKSNAPDGATIMVETRLKPVIERLGEDQTTNTLTSCGSEVVEVVRMFYNAFDSEGVSKFKEDKFSLSGILTAPAQATAMQVAASIVQRCDRLTKCNWHP